MSIGFVYVLLNPAFPQCVKIGQTARDPQKRARELSRQTGVPDDFIVIYDELVADAQHVEDLLHARFSEYRTRTNKEFFQIPPKEAIRALQDIALRFPVPSTTPSHRVDMLPHFTKYFAAYLDPKVTKVRLVQLPGVRYLEVARQPKEGGPPIVTQEELPIGPVPPEAPTLNDLRVSEARVRSLDAYDWIMIGANLFPVEIAYEIAREWERPGGELERKRRRGGGNEELA